ncbi:hypothetical protein [Nocardia sp. SC052]|uniref:hypothetical protein n=1 Tax=Nocardia sichangensis TaxID=3385975 RepID=UPI0039A05EBF
MENAVDLSDHAGIPFELQITTQQTSNAELTLCQPAHTDASVVLKPQQNIPGLDMRKFGNNL